jgi:diguanylate cyclase (GGDEF)-like protein
VLLAGELGRNQLATYAALHRADVYNIEAIAKRSRGEREMAREIAELLAAIGRRPGTHEALLVGPDAIVRASGTRAVPTGGPIADPNVGAALRGTAYRGHEAGAGEDARNFNFIAPVDLPTGRFAFEVSYDHAFLDNNLGDVRRTLLLVGVLALLVGAGVFYLVGGRSLMRSHRIALQRATRDGLTDLPNHRAFQDDLERAVALATRYGDSIALVVLDLDDFKYANERRGHKYGDAVLRGVTAVLLDGRVEDRAYRVGGDEFALLLSRVDAEGARTIADRLVDELSAGADVSVSVGPSDLRADQTADGLRAEAGAALNEAKAAAVAAPSTSTRSATARSSRRVTRPMRCADCSPPTACARSFSRSGTSAPTRCSASKR